MAEPEVIAVFRKLIEECEQHNRHYQYVTVQALLDDARRCLHSLEVFIAGLGKLTIGR